MNILIDGQTLSSPEINRGIGICFINLLENLIKYDFCNEYYIYIPFKKDMIHLSEYAKNRLNFIFNESFASDKIDYRIIEELNNSYSIFINQIISEKDIDLYWNPNPLMINVFYPYALEVSKAGLFFTIHDLIPFVMKENYMINWDIKIQEEYNKRLLDLKDKNIICDSYNTKVDVLKIIKPDLEPNIILLGVDSKFDYYKFPIKNNEPYFLYIGGEDYRKNMEELIKAFCFYKQKFKKEEKLYVICHISNKYKMYIDNIIKKNNMENYIFFTGYVEDIELLNIYKKAKGFIFPSLYEGFGLPVLEAYASGLPVACSNISSLPEVADKDAILFDPFNNDDIVKAFEKLSAKDNSLEKRKERKKYANKFTWDDTAIKMIDIFQKNKNNINNSIKLKNKIAWISPMPPMKTGIANYSYTLLKEMSKNTDISIDIYVEDNLEEVNRKIDFSAKIFLLNKLETKFDEYDEVFYHIGNNSEFHTEIYKTAWENPGTVIIHDWNIHPFMQHSFLGTKDNFFYEKAINYYGDEGQKEYLKTRKIGYPDIWKFSMSDALVSRSKRAIVHHRWVKKQYKKELSGKIDVIPHFSSCNIEPDVKMVNNLKEKYKIEDKSFIISVLGFINANKLPLEISSVIIELINEGYPIKVIFGGQSEEFIKDKIQNKFSTMEKKFLITGYLREEEYYSLIKISDLIINLRQPTVGEASGTLLHSLYMNKKIIIGKEKQYKEYHDNFVFKIEYDEMEKKLKEKIISFLINGLNYKSIDERYIHIFSKGKIIKKYLNIVR